jgi:hypothetical protein
MKRAFRVATIFTGAAACAAVMTPAAQAAVVVPGGGRFTPDYPTVRVCNDLVSGTENKVKLTYTSKDPHAPECFTGSGPWYVGGARFSRYCADSKSGLMKLGPAGASVTESFTGGTHLLYGQQVQSIDIFQGTPGPRPCS